MLYREIIDVCSEIHTKHINTLCGQNVELLNVKLVVYIVTTGLRRVSDGNWFGATDCAAWLADTNCMLNGVVSAMLLTSLCC